MSGIGDNLPPGPIECAAATYGDISAWMLDAPVIQDAESAKEAKLYLDRGKNALQDLEAARKQEVDPLNSKVKTINGRYKEAAGGLETLVGALKDRLADYIRQEAVKRQAAALEARLAAEAAEVLAREAEAKEQTAIDEAKQGVLADVGLAIREADAAFSDFQRAERDAQRARRDEHVKIGGGFKNAISLRTKETLVVTDGLAAIHSMGISERMITAILSDAREFRKRYGRLPAGIRIIEEEVL